MSSKVEVKDKDSKYNYEKGLAMKKLNPKASVKAMYKDIVENGKASRTTNVQRFWESFDRGPYEQDINSEAYYTQAIGYKALGRKNKAKKMFKKALKERNDNLWAIYYMTI
jgi:tetratricopeptide (TPR) repeat protein